MEPLRGRRRAVPEINASNFNVRNAAERMAINMPIQGTAADIMKIAMIRVHDQLSNQNMATKMLLQVHDELVFEVPEADAEALAALARQEMEAVVELDVPLVVNTGCGPTWLEAH